MVAFAWPSPRASYSAISNLDANFSHSTLSSVIASRGGTCRSRGKQQWRWPPPHPLRQFRPSFDAKRIHDLNHFLRRLSRTISKQHRETFLIRASGPCVYVAAKNRKGGIWVTFHVGAFLRLLISPSMASGPEPPKTRAIRQARYRR